MQKLRNVVHNFKPNQMIKKIDKILFQVIAFVINSVILIFLLSYQFFKNIENPKLILFFYTLLILQLIVILILLVKNLISKKIGRGIVYFFMATLSGFEIYFSFLFVGAFFLGMGTSVGDENVKNFKKTAECHKFNSDSVKLKIENISKNKFSKDFNKEFIEQIKLDHQDLPKKISKINCGCRITDSTIIVFRIWDKNQNTYELEIEKQNGKWEYKSLVPAFFE